MTPHIYYRLCVWPVWLASPASVAPCRVLWQDIVVFSRHPLGLVRFMQAFELNLRPRGKRNASIKPPLLVTSPNTMLIEGLIWSLKLHCPQIGAQCSEMFVFEHPAPIPSKTAWCFTLSNTIHKRVLLLHAPGASLSLLQCLSIKSRKKNAQVGNWNNKSCQLTSREQLAISSPFFFLSFGLLNLLVLNVSKELYAWNIEQLLSSSSEHLSNRVLVLPPHIRFLFTLLYFFFFSFCYVLFIFF